MDEPSSDSETSFRVRIDDSGRIVIPANSRLRRNTRGGEQLVAVEEPDGSLRLRKVEDVVREVQEYFRAKIPAGRSLVDELIAERRAEAARE